MQNQRSVSTLWQRLFERRGVHREPSKTATSATYFFLLHGRRRKVLTTEKLSELEESLNTEIRELDEDETSHQSFQTCVSNFEVGDLTNGFTSPLHLPIADLTFGHYISKSRLAHMGGKIHEKMLEHISSFQPGQGDDMEKFLTPGIGWEVQEDEQGPDVLSPSRFNCFEGMWRTDFERTDDNSMMIDLMEMARIYKIASKLIQYTEVVVTEEAINLYPKVLGFSFPTINYWTRDGKLIARRDLRRGKARITTVPTTFGFRQYVQWGEPYPGFAVAEGQLSADNDTFQIVNWIKRYGGRQCSLRAVFRRHNK